MFLVCNVTLPCDQREVGIDVSYLTMMCKSQLVRHYFE